MILEKKVLQEQLDNIEEELEIIDRQFGRRLKASDSSKLLARQSMLRDQRKLIEALLKEHEIAEQVAARLLDAGAKWCNYCGYVFPSYCKFDVPYGGRFCLQCYVENVYVSAPLYMQTSKHSSL